MILTQTDPTHKTSIRYDRSTRTWLAINGTVTDCATKNDALLVALANDQPALAAVVTELIRLHSDSGQTIINGTLKAAKLLVDGRVYDNGSAGSQSREITHQTNFDGITAKYDCTCEATVTDPVLGKICAHCLAVHVAYLVGIDLPAAPMATAANRDYLTDDSGINW